MLTTSSKPVNPASTSQTVKKLLTSTLPTADAKTPESDDDAPAVKKVPTKQNVNVDKNKNKTVASSSSSSSSKKQVKPAGKSPSKSASSKLKGKKSPSKKSPSKKVKSASSISKRANQIKQRLLKTDIVSAVLLKTDGTSSELTYNPSSSSVNKLLGGRPTIIGELEEIQVIVVRALSLYARNKAINKHVLPTPFCNKSYKGDYLLYRVNSKGESVNFTLNEYTKYVESTKKLTKQAQKNYNPIDNIEIKPKSIYNTQSKLTLIMLRSEADRKVRAEFLTKYKRKPTEDEVSKSVDATLQKLIDELVNNSGSPMNDPDYNPKDDIKKRIRDIYQKENGILLTDDELNKQIKRIKDDNDDNNDNNNNNNDDDIKINQKINKIDDRDWRLQLNDALKYVRARGRADGKKLAQKISQTFVELNGNEPTLNELINIFRRIKNELSNEAAQDMLLDDNNGSAFALAQKLGPNLSSADPSDLVDYAFRIVREDLISRAKSTFIISKGRVPNKKELSSTILKLTEKLAAEALDVADRRVNNIPDNDDDYDPNNINDQKLYQQDKIENQIFDSNYFKLKMLQSKIRKTKEAIKYDVYFCSFTKKQEAKNLEKAIDIFKLRNSRNPTSIEIDNLKKFLKTDKNTKLIKFKLSIVSDDDDDNDNDVDITKTTDQNDIDIDDDQKDIILSSINKAKITPTKVLVTPVKNKKTSARYDIYLDNNKFDSNANEKIAVQWFKRFNNRDPTKDEQDKIKKFVAADQSGLKVCNFNIATDKDNDNNNNNNDDLIKMKTKSIKNKSNSTKYILDFDDNKSRDNGDKQKAVKWFKRFNNRSPKKDEQDKIDKFIKKDLNNKNKNISFKNDIDDNKNNTTSASASISTNNKVDDDIVDID